MSANEAPAPTTPLVMHHGPHCPDGFASAMAAWMVFGDQAQYVPLDHGPMRTLADLPAVDARQVFLLDFCLPRALLEQIEERAAQLVVLDHHRSAADDLAGYVCSKGEVRFDMSKSGARLAWEYFHPDVQAPDLVRYVEDRDLWVWQYPQSAAFLAALDVEPMDFGRWREIAAFDAAQQAAFVQRGEAMDAKFRHLAQGMAEDARPIVLCGERGLMLNAPSMFHSLLGDLLCRKSGTFALLWTVDQNGRIKCGLRSRSGFDCIPLARPMGGGGHAQACGFRIDPRRLPELLGGNLDAEPPQG
ncbi:DHH family phosphoesterase [Candidatus Symbiobacter mobilis]|uniref:Phosphohydrolase-like protein n=1 Tax=Candidatus Symbiobacter mobilis CR TaxID=946483 RepID=U5NB07_9BURK|nr:DHHA1 domain-containing protein [Candidatus Symbiobacter mobilis]AGX88607.1 phosphohydrolase-like protein [Candidatus Symbiobacter mobilis CR]